MQCPLAELYGLSVKEGNQQKLRIRHVDPRSGEEGVRNTVDRFESLGKHRTQTRHGEEEKQTTGKNATLQGVLVVEDTENSK